MNERMKFEMGPTLVDRINSVRMSEVDRQVAVDAMRNARLLVDGWLWLTRKVGQLSSGGHLKPTAQH
jgi:hypothetical protein